MHYMQYITIYFSVYTLPGVEKRPTFEFEEMRCMLTLNNLNLRVVADWDVQLGSL